MQNNMEIPQKINNRTIIWSSNYTSGYFSDENKNTKLKRYMHPMVAVTLFMIAKTWEQTKCPSIDEKKKKKCYTHTREYYSTIKKEWNLTIYDTINRRRGYYSMWNKADRERQIVQVFTYMWTLKNKTNEQRLPNRKRVIDTENK